MMKISQEINNTENTRFMGPKCSCLRENQKGFLSNEQFYWTHSESLTIHGYLNFKKLLGLKQK